MWKQVNREVPSSNPADIIYQFSIFPFGNRRTKTVPGPTGQKCGQYLGKMWAEAGTHMGNPHSTWDPYETGGQKPYGPHMGCSYGAHIVAQMGPMWGHVFVLTWFISKSLSKLNEDSSL